MNKALALVILLSCIPLFVLIGIAVWINDRGSILYSQERLGQHRKSFRMYKFRTMYVNAEVNGPRLSHKKDERTFLVGRFLRKTHLDEIPQLWNILVGDMNFIGPRPEREVFANKYIMEYGSSYLRRFEVKGGLLGLSQILLGYDHGTMKHRVFFDNVLISNIHRKDVKIRLLLESFRYFVRGPRYVSTETNLKS